MADDRKIVVGSLITLTCSLGAVSLLLNKKRKHSAWVKKYIREREQYGECNTYTGTCCYGSGEMCPVYANGYRSIRGIAIH